MLHAKNRGNTAFQKHTGSRNLPGTGKMAQFTSPHYNKEQDRQQSMYLLNALKGGVAVAEGAQGVGHAVWARQGTQQQLEVIKRAC